MTEALSFSNLCKTWGIALTGGIASGKSTIGHRLRQRGYIVIDADQASRLVVEPGTEGFREVVSAFGPEIVNASGAMDRAKMREIVFADAAKRRTLETIIHQRLASVSEGLLRDAGLLEAPSPWFYEASLIYERGRDADFHSVWVAYCPREVQIQRVMARDRIDRIQAEAILKAQMPAEDKRAKADLVIETDCDSAELDRRIEKALESRGFMSSNANKKGSQQ